MNIESPKPEPFLDDRKALACVHCGLCLGACPTYLETGNENESPRGRIYLMRALQSGRLSMNDSSVRHIDLCLGCRACETACPSGVEYGVLLEATREQIGKRHRRSIYQGLLRRFAIGQVIPFPARMRLALWSVSVGRRLGLVKFLPRFLRDILELLPADVDPVSVPEFLPAPKDGHRGRVGFVSGCVMTVLFGATHRATLGLVNACGYDVVSPLTQVCCGALDAHGGNLDRAREFARKNIAAFEEADVDVILINAAGCGSTLKEYGHLLHADEAWAERARRFSAKVRDLTEWLVESIERLGLAGCGVDGPVTYHDACHLAHPQKITEAPRRLIRAVAGEHYRELVEADVCCGSAGSYNLTEPEMAGRLGTRKSRNILHCGALTVVTTNPGCILQIRAGLKQAGVLEVRVLHIAEFLTEALQKSGKMSEGSGGHA